MKKPEITPDEWKFDKEGCCVLNKSDNIIADTYQPFQVEHICNNNGRAIAAVPEMIDALIEADSIIREWFPVDYYGLNTGSKREEQKVKVLQIIHESLKKAGVEI